jgi:hypothetical protein
VVASAREYAVAENLDCTTANDVLAATRHGKDNF